MNWREILNTKTVDKRDKRTKTIINTTFSHFSPFSPVERELKSTEICHDYQSLSLDHLTDAEREAFEENVEIMVSPKFNLPLDQAEREAKQLVLRARRVLQARQAAEDYRRFGYVKIFSTVLKRAVYFVKDEQVAKNLPDQSLSVFLESDVETVKGLTPDEAKVLLEARIIFNGSVRLEDHSATPYPKTMDGKQIARNFYGK